MKKNRLFYRKNKLVPGCRITSFLFAYSGRYFMRKTVLRLNLLRVGMSCFLLAVFASLMNILLFPYARNLHSMTLPRLYIMYIVFFLILIFVSRFLKRTETPILERCAAWLIPAFSSVSFLLMLVCGFFLAHQPFCDNDFVLKGAIIISRYGKLSPELNDYIHKYLLHFPNQWGFVLLLSLLPLDTLTASLGSNSILYLLSGILAGLFAASFMALLHTVRKHFGVRAELMLAFCLAFFLPQYPAGAVLYTDTFSMPFVILALCCMLHIDEHTSRKQIILLCIGCGIFLLIGSLIKMTCLILFLAAAIVWLLTLHPKRAIACIMIPLLILSVGIKATNYHMTHHILESEDASRYETPLLHWFMMSIPTENNLYGSNTDDYDYTWLLMDQGASHEEIMQSIYTRIDERMRTYKSIKDVVYAAICKNANYIGDGTFGMWEMLDDLPLRENILSSIFLYYGQYYSLYADLCGGIWLAHLTLSVLLCLKHIRKHIFCLSIPMIAFLGLLIFEMLWEARSRYMFNLAPLILLITACGMTQQEDSGFTGSIIDRFGSSAVASCHDETH